MSLMITGRVARNYSSPKHLRKLHIVIYIRTFAKRDKGNWGSVLLVSGIILQNRPLPSPLKKSKMRLVLSKQFKRTISSVGSLFTPRLYYKNHYQVAIFLFPIKSIGNLKALPFHDPCLVSISVPRSFHLILVAKFDPKLLLNRHVRLTSLFCKHFQVLPHHIHQPSSIFKGLIFKTYMDERQLA